MTTSWASADVFFPTSGILGSAIKGGFPSSFVVALARIVEGNERGAGSILLLRRFGDFWGSARLAEMIRPPTVDERLGRCRVVRLLFPSGRRLPLVVPGPSQFTMIKPLSMA
jgi:hypothetical protein